MPPPLACGGCFAPQTDHHTRSPVRRRSDVGVPDHLHGLRFPVHGCAWFALMQAAVGSGSSPSRPRCDLLLHRRGLALLEPHATTHMTNPPAPCLRPVLIFMYTAISASNLTGVCGQADAHSRGRPFARACSTTGGPLIAWAHAPLRPRLLVSCLRTQVKLHHEIHARSDLRKPGASVITWDVYTQLLKQRQNITAKGMPWWVGPAGHARLLRATSIKPAVRMVHHRSPRARVQRASTHPQTANGSPHPGRNDLPAPQGG